jgi:acyl carrier protein
MTEAELVARILELVGNIAPETDLAAIQPDRPLRDQLDVDSMDLLNLAIAIDRELHVEIPDADYRKLTTLNELAAYVAARLS